MQIGGRKLDKAVSESGGSQRPASRVSSSVTIALQVNNGRKDAIKSTTAVQDKDANLSELTWTLLVVSEGEVREAAATRKTCV